MKCKCGCGKKIIPKKWHKWYRHDYAHGHNSDTGKDKVSININCDNCKKTFKYRFFKCYSHLKHRFCSRKCTGQYKRKICKNKNRYFSKEHRAIIEKIINKKLPPYFPVHHINKIKNDNRVKNLMVFSSPSAHARYHCNPSKVKPEEIIFDGRLIKTKIQN